MRMHWMALVSPIWICGLILGAGMIWAEHHPALLLQALHITRSSPLSTPAVIFFAKPVLWIMTAFVISGAFFAMKWLSWSMSYIEADRNSLSFRIGPFSSNTIPTRSIQDVAYVRGVFGLALNYGTITLASGLNRVVIEYVPNVQDLAVMLQRAA